MLLAGDIGGTKTVIALFEDTGKGLRARREEVFPSREHASLEEILVKFLQGQGGPAIEAGCFGVAGPVFEGRAKTTNLPWRIEERALAQKAGVPRVKLLNDLEATAYGMLHLPPGEFHTLAEGTPRKGNIAVIAAGTGLGEAMLYWDGSQYHPIASEGGHADFAPRDEEQDGLLRYLRRKHGEHVSYERVLSGPGMLDVYRFLRAASDEPEPAWLTQAMAREDPSAVVTQAGLAEKDPVCVRAVEMFSSIYGAEAANLALKFLAVGGVLLGGGIAPKMLAALDKGHFMRTFTAKGRYSDLLRAIPVKVSLNPRAALLGAAHYALTLSLSHRERE